MAPIIFAQMYLGCVMKTIRKPALYEKLFMMTGFVLMIFGDIDGWTIETEKSAMALTQNSERIAITNEKIYRKINL